MLGELEEVIAEMLERLLGGHSQSFHSVGQNTAVKTNNCHGISWALQRAAASSNPTSK